MKSVSEILTIIKTDAESQLPALILSGGLDAIDDYEIGESRDARKSAFLVYQDMVNWNYLNNLYQFTYQLQLPGVNVLDAAKYTDVVLDWIKNYDVSRVGAVGYQQVIIDTWPNAENQNTFIFFDVFFEEELDSCD